MTRLAVFVPTRSRPDNLSTVINAWWHTGAFAVADLIVGIDVDDMEFKAYQDIASGQPQVKMAVFPEWKPLVPKLNHMAAVGIEDGKPYTAMAFMGDDHVPISPMWAHTLLQNHTRHPGSIWYGPDGLQDRKLCSWWSMDTEIVRRLGGRMVPAPVQHMYCDNSVMKLGETTGRLNYDERVLIEHRHPFANKARMDAQYERVNRPAQYDMDGALFHQWVAAGLAEDAKLLADLGG